MPWRRVATGLAVFAAGIALGGYLFSQTRARDVLPFKPCEERCFVCVRPTHLDDGESINGR